MKEYVKKYRSCFVLVFLFTLVCYGFMLTHFALSIDEETWIMGGNIEGWLRQSRYSLWFYDLLFTKNGNYVPFLYDFVGIVLWNFSGIGLAYTLLKDKECHPLILFSALAYYNSLPFVMADIMSFSMYLIQIGIGALCTVYAVYLSISYVSEHHKKDFFVAVLLLWWAFGTYQAFICYYISAFAGYCVLEYLTHEKQDIWKKIGIGALICVCGVIGYIGIDKVANAFAGSDGYLQGSYIGWKDENPLLNFLMSFANVGRVSFAIAYQGVKVNGASCLRVLTILFVIDAFYRAHFEKRMQEKVFCVFLCAALCFAPFLLYIAMATYKTVGRMMLGLPVIGVVQIYLIGNDLKKKSLQKIGACVLAYFLFVNACDINRAYYDQSVSYGKDCEIVTELMKDIQKNGMDYHQKPIVLIGMIDRDYVPENQLGELGSSFFSHDDGNYGRMISFMNSRGYGAILPSVEQMNEGYQISVMHALSNWPMENSIVETENEIVIKLSDPSDKWFMVNGVTK